MLRTATEGARQATTLAEGAAVLSGLATALPPHRLDQQDVIAHARRIFGARTGLFETLEPVYTNAEIDSRWSCMPLDWFESGTDMPEKTRLYTRHATELAETAALAALRDAGLAPEDIDVLVFVSSTGIATPSIEARLMNRIGFRPDVARLPIFGLGCAGGAMGLARAGQMVAGRPGARCLLIVVELCTLAFRHDSLSKSNLVATALFGDGAAAAVLTGAAAGTEGNAGGIGRLGAAGEHLWPDTLNVMGWGIDPEGFEVIFHRDIPQIVEGRFRAAMEDFCARAGIAPAEIARPCCHPGGVKVLDALEGVFGLPPRGLEAERAVMRDCGNMSAPTVLFVLDRLRRDGATGPHLLTALGPGFTGAFQMLSLGPAQ
ncbi:type III polyketide synthase [Plastorhodobacter daqingensis]|uniref:Type III polyketide synthase n=1 Tax=Plastorhodobacter daqingensis TaxID=1387281 RepID=A0ABW2UHB9_9RHOB